MAKTANNLHLVKKFDLVRADIQRVAITENSVDKASFKLIVRNSQELLKQVMQSNSIESQCIFTVNKESTFRTEVISLISLSKFMTELECEMPSIPLSHPSDSLLLSLQVTQFNSLGGTDY